MAAAVILLKKDALALLNDSKQLSAAQRENLFPQILRNGLIGIGTASEEEIDRINIYHASRLAMRRAVLALTRTPDLILVDGKARLDWPLPQKCIIDGDAKSASVAAASIVAKVYRDAWMKHLHSIYPQYNFHEHKGYATPGHLERIRENGPSPVHRKSFSPFRENSQKEFLDKSFLSPLPLGEGRVREGSLDPHPNLFPEREKEMEEVDL
jgi:ribonuclease HII